MCVRSQRLCNAVAKHSWCSWPGVHERYCYITYTVTRWLVDKVLGLAGHLRLHHVHSLVRWSSRQLVIETNPVINIEDLRKDRKSREQEHRRKNDRFKQIIKGGTRWIFVCECFNVVVAQQNTTNPFSTGFNLLEIEWAFPSSTSASITIRMVLTPFCHQRDSQGDENVIQCFYS